MKEYIEREAVIETIKNHKCKSKVVYSIAEVVYCVGQGIGEAIRSVPAADVIEADRLGRVGRLMLPNKGCPRGPIGRLGMAGGKTQDKKAILIEELCCMDTFEDVDGNVWRPVQEEVLQEVIEILRAQSTVRHAKWVSSEQYNGRPECPVCFYVTDEKTNYCPHCGAKMDKEDPEEVLDRYKANRLYRNEKGLLFAESDRGTQLICSQLCPSIRCGESYHGYEPKSITRPELPDPPEPETVTFGEYVEITELLAMPDEVLIPFITDIEKLCSRLNSYNHFANRFLKEE